MSKQKRELKTRIAIGGVILLIAAVIWFLGVARVTP